MFVAGLQEEMDPYEKLLSPCRKTRRSARLSQAKNEDNKESEPKVEAKDKKEGKKSESLLGHSKACRHSPPLH